MSAILPPTIVIFAVSFNALLAIVNGHGVGLNQSIVVLTEMAIYGTALSVIVTHADRRMLPWFVLTVFIILTGLLIAVGNGQFNPKYIRDVLVIPVFIMLGMTYKSENFAKPLLILHSIVFAVGALEIVSPSAYSEIFQILKYYVGTRDFSANQFWNTESTLFVSATRPGARFFGFVDWHRASSVFLEPVSLGNYCVIAAILIVACWSDFSGRARAYLTGSTFFLLVACDGRLAATSIAMVLAALLVLNIFSSRWTLFYLPVTVAASGIYLYFFGQAVYSDNFAGRVMGTMDALGRLDVDGLMGMTTYAVDSAADNGVVYFILSQSVIGVAVIWSTICMLAPDRTMPSRLYMHAIGLFIPLSLMVSNSFFSIKTAALMWFFYGYRYIRDIEAADEPPAEWEAFPALDRPVAREFS